MDNIIILLQKCLSSFSNIQITMATISIIILAVHLYLKIKPKPIYLVDFACFKPLDSLRVPESHFLEHSELSKLLDQDSLAFQEKLLLKSGIGPESHMPDSVHQIPIDLSLSAAMSEIQTVLFEATEDLLSKTQTNPNSIDIIVTNCSLVCPTPSISSMIIEKFKLRSDIKSFNLSGMGCSAGIIAVGLAKDLLRSQVTNPKKSMPRRALVLSMESVSTSGYKGKVKSMLVGNVLFRMGGAAILLSTAAAGAKYKLRHIVRTHLGADDEAYRSVYQGEDEMGNVGVSISRSLVKVASKALTVNTSRLGPLVLPYSEQVRYALSAMWRAMIGSSGSSSSSGAFSVYVPDFKRAFEHFCVHAGGRAVIDGLKIGLRLSEEDCEASRMTLYRFGNTSSSSIWYELCYLEAKGRVKRGDRVWQIAFGSGFKCNSAVWVRVKDNNHKEINAWSDRIDRYPVQIIQNVGPTTFL